MGFYVCIVYMLPNYVVEDKQLLRDVHTRWDSMYQMLKRLRIMRLVRLDLSLKLHASSLPRN